MRSFALSFACAQDFAQDKFSKVRNGKFNLVTKIAHFLLVYIEDQELGTL